MLTVLGGWGTGLCTVLGVLAFQGRWLAWTIFYAVFVANLILDAWLLRVLHRQAARKYLPWFFLYIAWEFISTATGLIMWLISRDLYTVVYWWKEALRMTLLVGAVRESLLRIFKGFEVLLRWSVLVVILAVVAYSWWKAAYAPPIQSNRVASFILGAEFTFRWGVAGVSVVAMVLMWFIQEPAGSREDAVITGAAIASMGFVAWVIMRSVFGTRFVFFAQYLPDMGYFVAVFYWIRVFKRPVQEYGFKELGMGPEDIRGEMHRYGELVEKILESVRKLW